MYNYPPIGPRQGICGFLIVVKRRSCASLKLFFIYLRILHESLSSGYDFFAVRGPTLESLISQTVPWLSEIKLVQ